MKTIPFSLVLLLTGEFAMGAFLPVCERTEAIQKELEVLVKKPCGEMTEADLAAIKRVAVPERGVSVLKAEDFSGMPNLEIINLIGNPLERLPEGLTKELRNLRTFAMFDTPIRFLPHDFLEGNEKMENLHIFANGNLKSLSVSMLSRLEAMQNLKVLDFDKALNEPERIRLRTRFPEGGPVELTFF